MSAFDKIITKKSGRYGAPLGRASVGKRPTDGTRIFDRAVPMDSSGCYDRGGVYWGIGSQLRVEYTKDLKYIRFYRKYEINKQFHHI